MEELEFPRSVFLKNAGITYIEEGPNAIFLNLVLTKGKDEDTEMIALVGSIDQSDLGNQFSAMTFGKILYSIPLVEFLDNIKVLEEGPEENENCKK